VRIDARRGNRTLWGRRRVGNGGRRRIVGWESAVFVGATGCETIVAVRRAARGFGTLVGGPAGIATDVSMNTLICGAILDGPYSIARLAGTPHHLCPP
jgi:hypothetical protein